MRDVVFGLVAIVAGLVFCFRGFLTMRVVIPIWGAFAGFSLGAGLIAELTDNRFLRTTAGWMLGLGLALVFGLLAYLYYEVSIVIGAGAIGFVLGSTLMVALNVTWTWVIILVGVAAGALLAVAAIVGDLPMIVLTVLTALGGASATVAGLMLLTGTLTSDDLTRPSITEKVDDSAAWWIIYAALALFGMVAQIKALDSLTMSVRAEWDAERSRA